MDGCPHQKLRIVSWKGIRYLESYTTEKSNTSSVAWLKQWLERNALQTWAEHSKFSIVLHALLTHIYMARPLMFAHLPWLRFEDAVASMKDLARRFTTCGTVTHLKSRKKYHGEGICLRTSRAQIKKKSPMWILNSKNIYMLDDDIFLQKKSGIFFPKITLLLLRVA